MSIQVGMPGELHVGAIGTTLRPTFTQQNEMPLDISEATLLEISFARPDGSTFVRTATRVEPGTDGVAEYALQAGDLDVAGYWTLQGLATLPDGYFPSNRVRIRVLSNNAVPD